MATRIAVVDDEPIVREMVVDYLGGRGFEVQGFSSAAEFRASAVTALPELVLLDVLMPGEDGLSLLRWIRGFSEVPVIMLTGENDTADRVSGLELGADDYVAKPADLRELLARVRSALRRNAAAGPAAGVPVAPVAPVAPAAAATAAAYDSAHAWFGRWRLDRQRHRLVDSGGEVCTITGADYALLAVFADHPNVVLSREKLLELSGTDPGEVFDRAIDLRITRLRKKIEPVPGDPTVIRTVRGFGGGYEYLPSAGPNYGR
ncbi:response regulator transcription factor [Hydrocarboniphaga sp.]|uniref:response regulator transcription factor n=1 Tax=Hydrocarboniphaga sp. TaxID=2033016 RepID=UPI003D0A2051